MSVLQHFDAHNYIFTATTADPAVEEKLPFTMQSQAASNWCWAAVSTSVSHFFDAASKWTQCGVANALIPSASADCCTHPTPGDCNVRMKLSGGLGEVNHLRSFQDKPVPLAVTEDEIKNKKCPIGVTLQSPTLVHFAVLYGYVAGSTPMMLLKDPAQTVIPLSYGSLIGGPYGVTASWTYTYFTQA